MRGAIIAVAVASALPAPAQAAERIDPVTELAKTIDIDGWEFLTASSNAIYLTRPERSGAGHMRRIWLRMDFVRAEDDEIDPRALSAVVLIEANCKDGRMRPIQLETYAANSLKGKGLQSGARDNPWVFPIPNSYGDYAVKRACGEPLP